MAYACGMLVLQAPSKLNLDLRVGRRRDDGYHPLASWFVTTSLADVLRFEVVRTSGIELTCDDPTLSCGPDNLVCKAARLLLEGRHFEGGLRVHLEKRIPAGGGLGGGSSDAAATLKALRTLHRLPVSDEELVALAGRLGSDVPFFAAGVGSAVCTGRGELVHPAPWPRQPFWAVLVWPGLSVSTAEVYRVFDAMNGGQRLPDARDTIAQVGEWSRGPAAKVMEQLANDLEAAAMQVQPALKVVQQMSQDACGTRFRMTGSGSTWFSLFDDEASACSAAQRVADAFGVAAELPLPSKASPPPRTKAAPGGRVFPTLRVHVVRLGWLPGQAVPGPA